MARKNVEGNCRLCGKHGPLCKSHYVGRAVERLGSTNGEPKILLTPQLAIETQRQLWTHLLCPKCEGRLNKLGETPVVKLLDDGKRFPLLNLMQPSHALSRTPDVMTFSGRRMGIDSESLAHFVLGILWKGAVHDWKTVEKQTSRVNLGEFEEPIRRYLLGETELPDGVYVGVSVCTDLASRGMVLPPAEFPGKFRRFSILVRGVWFFVITDKQRSIDLKNMCCVRSKEKVLHFENCEQRLLHGTRIFFSAKVAPNLRS